MLSEINANHHSSTSCIVALHSSLNSGRQWRQLAALANDTHRFIAPDLSGYGNNRASFDLPTSLALEVDFLKAQFDAVAEPIHLVGHSYGGAVAFRIATTPDLADRIRSLTLIEPVLPTVLKENAADRRLHDRFAALGHDVCADIWNGAQIDALDKFTAFWNGSASFEPIPEKTQVRLLEHIEKVAFDFCAILGEEGVTAAAETIKTPTLLFSGGLSPYMTQRIVGRLASIIPLAEAVHLTSAGHMLPLTHGAVVNEAIMKHIARADDCADVPLVADQFGSGEVIKMR
jgi:pimeloyl-ACP methyl ester carboxylesterase